MGIQPIAHLSASSGRHLYIYSMGNCNWNCLKYGPPNSPNFRNTRQFDFGSGEEKTDKNPRCPTEDLPFTFFAEAADSDPPVREDSLSGREASWSPRFGRPSMVSEPEESGSEFSFKGPKQKEPPVVRSSLQESSEKCGRQSSVLLNLPAS